MYTNSNICFSYFLFDTVHDCISPVYLCRMRIALTDYSSQEEVLRAVRDLPYVGGSRRMGDALQFLVDSVFSPVISRDHAPKVECFM